MSEQIPYVSVTAVLRTDSFLVHNFRKQAFCNSWSRVNRKNSSLLENFVSRNRKSILKLGYL